MPYPSFPKFEKYNDLLLQWARLKHEYGSKAAGRLLKKAEQDMKKNVALLQKLPIDPILARKEPNTLREIKALRPAGPRILKEYFDEKIYREKLRGALIGRLAGCTLGAPVEFWLVEDIEGLAMENGEKFPPRDYFSYVYRPWKKRYQVSRVDAYTSKKMNGVPVDDDIAYTQLGLLILEDHGIDFTVADVGKAWVKYLPYACTAEEVALNNLKKKVPAMLAGEKDNPYCEWIGADIRSDPWGYAAPWYPEKAAEMAYTDAYISHRRQGIYGEMYFSAAIAAAFAVKDPVTALELGLTEIPRDCAMAKAVRWALDVSPKIKNYKAAREAVDKKFIGMHPVHTINNACLTVFGITIGGKDFTRVIGETVAMGLDNDCTAATAGSIVGAVVGISGIPKHWYKKFNDKTISYLKGHKTFGINDMVDRFTLQARKVYQ